MKKIIYILSLVLLSQWAQAQVAFTLQAGAGYSNYQWFSVGTSGATPITGANASTYAPNAPGIYYATFDGTNCGTNATEYYILTANNDTSLVLNANQNNVNYNWYLDNNQISGAVADSLAIISVDTLKYYQAEITENGCTKLLPGFHVYHLGMWAPLPIELVSFDAVLHSDRTKVNLNWQTASEINSDYFIVERSVDQLNWEFVLQKQAAGNSIVDLSYTDIDYNPKKGRSYYRLKMVDIDNSFKYSQVRSVIITDAVQYVKIYPNPFTNKIKITAPEDEFESLKIYNTLGDIVIDVPFNENRISSTEKEIDVSSLAVGMYFLQTKTSSAKILKVD